MELKWMAVGAFALIPCAAMAQSKTARDSSKQSTAKQGSSQTTSSQTTTSSTSTGDVSSNDPNVTQAMMQAQNNANMIGTPAWWKTHGTAQGGPIVNRSGSGTTH